MSLKIYTDGEFKSFSMNVNSANWPSDTYGVYSITNKVSGRRCVGVTSSTFKVRWRNHRTELRGNYHGNPIVQNSYNLHGEDSFFYEIIEILESKEDGISKERENYWITKLCGRVEDGGFNLRDGDGFYQRSEEMRLSQKNRALKRFGNNFEFKDPEGNLVKIEDIVSFCRKMNYTPAGMYSLHRGEVDSYMGYTRSNSTYIPLKKREIILVSPLGEEVTFACIKTFCEKFGLTRSGISGLVNKRYKTWKGWELKYANISKRKKTTYRIIKKQKTYSFKDPSGNIITTPDLTLFCIENNLRRNPMLVAIKNKTGNCSYKGYTSVDSIYIPRCNKYYVFVSPNGQPFRTNDIAGFARQQKTKSHSLRLLTTGKRTVTVDGWRLST